MRSQDLLVLIWVHGFKGTDVTFENFPDRIVRILEDTHPSLSVVSQVFPAYETRGELNAATENFVEWLTRNVVELENGGGDGKGAGSAKVVLMGHSMGGLLIADAVRRIADETRTTDPLWPNVVATIAYDTPYLGLHPHVFKHQLSQAASYAETARTVAGNLAMLSPLAIGFGFGKAKQAQDEEAAENAKERSPAADSNATVQEPSSKSWWSAKAAMGLGALAMGAAAAAGAYYREDLQNTFYTGWRYGFDHMTFVRNLWDSEGLNRRMEAIQDSRVRRHVVFANFFTCLPPKPPLHPERRTFAILPPNSDPLRPFWIPQVNSIAKDEIGAHMGMFNALQNDGFYDLGLKVTQIIARRIQDDGVATTTPAPAEEDIIDLSSVEKTPTPAPPSQKEKDIIDLTGDD